MSHDELDLCELKYFASERKAVCKSIIYSISRAWLSNYPFTSWKDKTERFSTPLRTHRAFYVTYDSFFFFLGHTVKISYCLYHSFFFFHDHPCVDWPECEKKGCVASLDTGLDWVEIGPCFLCKRPSSANDISHIRLVSLNVVQFLLRTLVWNISKHQFITSRNSVHLYM